MTVMWVGSSLCWLEGCDVRRFYHHFPACHWLMHPRTHASKLIIKKYVQGVDPGCTGNTVFQLLALFAFPEPHLSSHWMLGVFSIERSIFHCWFSAQSVVVGIIFTERIREKVIVKSFAETGRLTAKWLEIFSGAERLQMAIICVWPNIFKQKTQLFSRLTEFLKLKSQCICPWCFPRLSFPLCSRSKLIVTM